MKGGHTAQGNCLATLATASKKTVALSGTLCGGYGDDLFYILYRLSPKTIKDENIEYGKVSRWMSRYGVLEKITKYKPEDNSFSKGKRGCSTLRRRPGISPMVFSRHLMSKCAFLHLSDIALDLPPITEDAVMVKMDDELESAYKMLEKNLISAVRQSLAKGSKSLLGTYLNGLLSYPDRPFDNNVIVDPHDGSVIAIPTELPKDRIYPKEKQLILNSI